MCTSAFYVRRQKHTPHSHLNLPLLQGARLNGIISFSHAINRGFKDIHLYQPCESYDDLRLTMVPHQAPLHPPPATQPTLPSLTRGNTLPVLSKHRSDRSLLTPEDAIYAVSPRRKQSAAVNKLQKDLRMTNGNGDDIIRIQNRGRHKERNGRSGSSRRRKGTWKKLLWVKQSCTLCHVFSRTELIFDYRSGQLHRSRYLPRAPAAKPSTSTL